MNPTQPLAGRVALVTGAAGALGAATAALLAERGATVVCVVRRTVDGVPDFIAQVLHADVTRENERFSLGTLAPPLRAISRRFSGVMAAKPRLALGLCSLASMPNQPLSSDLVHGFAGKKARPARLGRRRRWR